MDAECESADLAFSEDIGEVKAMQTSTLWLLAILLGVSLVARANIQYPRARDTEKKQAVARQSRMLLQPELERNSQLLAEMLKALESSGITVDAFDTTAWQTVSRSDLLLGLPDSDLSQVMQAYYLMNRANNLHAKFLETTVGVASALQGSGQTRQLLLASLRGVLTELQPLLRSATSSGRASG